MLNDEMVFDVWRHVRANSGATLMRRVLVVDGFVDYVAAGFVYWTLGGLVVVAGAWIIVLWGMQLAGLWLTSQW